MKHLLPTLLSLLAALLAGIAGHVATTWIAHQGFYAMILPGGLIGLAAAAFHPRSYLVPPACAAWALFISLLTQWHLFPFNADPSFPYFLSHIPNLQPLTLIMIATGTALAFFLPFPRRQPQPQPPAQSPPPP